MFPIPDAISLKKMPCHSPGVAHKNLQIGTVNPASTTQNFSAATQKNLYHNTPSEKGSLPDVPFLTFKNVSSYHLSYPLPTKKRRARVSTSPSPIWIQ